MVKNNSVMKRITSAFLCACMIFGALLSPILACVDLFASGAEEDPIPMVGFTTEYEYATKEGYTRFEVKLSLPQIFDVNVSFHTENRSAIGGTEPGDGIDYCTQEGVVTIPAGQMTGEIFVTMYGQDIYAALVGDRVMSRYFAVVLDEVTEGITIDPDFNTNYGHLFTRYNIPVTVTDDISYFTEYANTQYSAYGKAIVYSDDDKDTWRTWEHNMTLNNATTQGWVNTFINSGFADVWGTMLVEKFNHGPDCYQIYNCYCYFGDSAWKNGKISPFFYADVDPTKYIGNFDNPHAGWYWNQGAWTTLLESGKNPHDSNETIWDLDDWSVNGTYKKFSFKNPVESWYGKKNATVNTHFFKVTPYNNTVDLAATFKNSAIAALWTDYDLWGPTLLMVLRDTKKPEVVSVTMDESSLCSTGKLRLIVKFSEPMYAKESTAIGVIFNESPLANAEKYFEYAGGNYTDTLFFEWQAENIIYESYTYKFSETSIDSIGDLSYNLSEKGNVTNFKVTEFASTRPIRFTPRINYSKPVITFNNRTSGWSKYHEVDVYFGLADQGTLYYLWDNSPYDITDPALYGDSKMTIDLADVEGPSMTTLTLSNVNGPFYLHVLFVTRYGLKKAGTIEKALYFDNSPPEVTMRMKKNALPNKAYYLNFFDVAQNPGSAGGSGFSKLTMTIFDENGRSGKSYVLYDKNTKEQDPLLSVREVNDEFTCVYYSALFDLTTEGEKAETEAEKYYYPDQKIIDLMGDKERMTFIIRFTLTDNCGNTVATADQRVTYDSRESFGIEYEVGDGITPMQGLEDIEAYNIGGKTSTSLTIRSGQGSGHLRLSIKDSRGNNYDGITYNGMQIGGTVDASVNPDEIKLEGLKPGYYEISPYFVMDSFEGKEEVLVSDVIRFYVTSGMNDDTVNYTTANKGNLVLKNEVWQLPNVSYYYLPEIGGNPKSFYYGAKLNPSTGKYEGGSSTPSFSSMNQLRDYVTYMEYQDLYLVSITASAAKFLNNGTGSTIYVKADGETTNAEEGQLWIRYKRSTWSSTASSYGWVFYYYGSGSVEDGIDLRAISGNLRNAIYAVRDTICKSATVKYLVEYDSTDSATGAPKLSESQMHYLPESVAKTIMGTPYESPNTFAGDADIYQNFVKFSYDKSLPLVTNMPLYIGSSTKLYYKYGYETGTPWTPVESTNGTIVRKALPNCTTGLYTILEADEYGINQFEVYIDITTPKIDVVLNGEEKTIDNDTSVFSGTTFSFAALYGEIDEYAYAAVYSYTSGDLLNVYYADDIAKVSLSGSNYYVQVGDRSGNSFTFTLRLADKGLDVTAELSSSGTGVVVTVKDRSESEIYRYEVYCNNVLINSAYVERKLYSLPGVYSIFVQDIYGNVYRSKNITYTRSAPNITWYYQNSYGTYTAYDPEKAASMIIVEDETAFGQYLISTSALLRFRISDELGKCEFEFTGLEESGYNVDNTGSVVTISVLSGWTLKVWYDEYPDDYVTYVCTIDDVAPIINVTFIGTPYSLNEADAMAKGTTTVPSTLGYTKQTNTVMTATDGDVFTGSYISISASDNFGMRNVSVTLNGSAISAAADEDGVYHFEAYGKYVVTATDIFNNVKTFTFTNTEDSSATFQTDGKAEERSSQTETSYGRDRAVMNVSRAAEAEILIKSGSEKEYYHYKFADGVMYKGKYVIMTTDSGKSSSTEWSDMPVLEIGVAGVQSGIWVEIDSFETYTVYAQLLQNGGAKFRVDCLSGTQNIEMRAITGYGCLPDYRMISLSKEGTDLTIYSGGQKVQTNREGYVTYLSSPIEIKAIKDNLIVKVEESFSAAMNFSSFTTVYTDTEDVVEPYDHERKGFYCVRVTNVYGNTLEYILRYSDSASIVITATYRDGSDLRYSADYKKEICSNNLVTVSVYGQNIKFRVDGVDTAPVLDKDCSKLTFYNYGRFMVEVIEASGTVSAYTIVISSDPNFTFSEKWIVGYNESALKRQEGYTNLKLSAVPDLNKVSIVFVEKDGEIYTIYDVLSEDAKTDANNLRYCIGNQGDGTYTVGFRDLYGDLVTKTVYYRETPTLKLSRVTVVSGESEPYDVNKAVEKGFYSSNSLTFETDAGQYIFTIDGEAVMLDIPKTYEFNTASGNGLFRYDVAYLDEYGFSYNFGAFLMRQDVQISTKNMRIVEVEDVKFTSDDVNVVFDEEYEAFYTLNDGEKTPYRPGQPLRRDGKYNLTVTDIAGNVATLALTRDSVVRFGFFDAKTDREVIKGGVANDTTVVFRSEEAEITNVFRDGKELTKFDDTRFNLTGKWEILMKDEVGNTAYFSFVLINNALKEFSYETPYGYTVSEVWKTDNDGNRFRSPQKGEEIELSEDGVYSVVMLSDWDNMALNFTVKIDTTPPKIKLVGCEEGEETANEVTLSGLSIGDVVSVYRNDELEKEIEIENVRDVPVFKEGGSYEIVVRNLAGVSTSLRFTRKHIANTAASVLIIIGCFALATGIFVGLLYRNRSKIDK